MPGRLKLAPLEERLTLTVREAAALAGVSTWAYYEGIKRGEVPAQKIGNRIVVPRVQLDSFLAGTWTRPA